MTWRDAKQLARQGKAVRRPAWPSSRGLIYAPDGAPFVALIVTTTSVSGGVTVTRTKVTNADFGASEFTADDWVAV